MGEVHSFNVPMKSSGGYIEPDIDDSVDFTCELVGGNFVVKVENVDAQKLASLKSEYQFVKTETVTKEALESPDKEVAKEAVK